METTAAGAAVARGGVSLPISSSSQPSRKEWRVVSEHLVRHAANEDLERSKLFPSDERLIYERLQTVAKQRDELQHMEIELRGQLIARAKIVDMQSSCDAQIQEHVNNNIKLQEQLHEMEQKMRDLERNMEDKERELHAIRLDNEAAWAKEDLLREQNKELQSYRRERDKAEAERVQHIKQIHDLQEHIQEKERQFMEMQEQHRIAQEAVVFKEEKLREAQAWMTRAREMDVLQSTANHALQAELHERTEQCNHLWLGCQRQLAEMERLHLHIQQLQLGLSDVRGRNGSYSDGPHVSETNSKDGRLLGQSNGRQLEGSGSPCENSASLQNGNSEITLSLTSGGSFSSQMDPSHSVLVSPSLLALPTYPAPGQMSALHPFVIHQQGLSQSIHSQVTQSHLLSVPAIPSNHPAIIDTQHAFTLHYQQTEKNSVGADSHYDFEGPGNGHVDTNVHYLDNSSEGLNSESLVPSPNEEVRNSIDNSNGCVQTQQSLQQVSSQFHNILNLDSNEHNNETKEKDTKSIINHGVGNNNVMMEPFDPAVNSSSSEAPKTTLGSILTDDVSTLQMTNIVEMTGETYLLDERSLLACIVRTIGSGGRIRISSTLPNRLGKMLSPLHWHDYKKKYGKLDEFVAIHLELFMIEDDYIQLREGAQETIAATAAVAKVAAVAASTPSSYSSFLPSVTVTPMAQPHRSKKLFLETSSVNASPRVSNLVEYQNLNGITSHVGVPSVKILSKPKDLVEARNTESGRSGPVENGTHSEKKDFSQNKGTSQGIVGTNLVAKQQIRAIAASPSPRR